MSQFIEMFGDVIKNSNDWREYGPIGNYADIVLGSTPDSKNPKYWDGDICWVTPAELNDDVVVINDTVRHITNDGVSAANLTKLPKGSILFSTRAPIGKVAITGVEMYCNQGFKNFICGDKLNNLYLYYTLKLNRDYLCALGTGTTFKELSKKVVESISIAIPPIEMQNKFEDVFKHADKSKFVGFKSQFIEMCEGDDQVPLGDICNIEKGATITRNDVLPGDIPVVAGGQEPSCYHNVANREAGAITVSASGAYAGYINLWSCPIFASDCNTVISKDAEKTDQTFVYFGLKAMQKQIYGLQKGGAQPHVYGKDLQKFMFPHPSYAKQIEFSKMAKQADKSKFVD